MARLYLSIPATSVPAEQVFSIAGQILTKRRASLTDNMVNTILCSRNWLGLSELEKQEVAYESRIVERAKKLEEDSDFAVCDAGADDDELKEKH